MTKHTPTPWRIDKRCSTLIVAAKDRGICSTGGYSDNSINSEDLLNENKANAELIVRACNSHEALLSALIELDQLVSSQYVLEYPAGTFELVRNAIREASK